MRMKVRSIMVGVVCASMLGMGALTGCLNKAGASSLTSEVVEDTGAFVAHATKADAKTSVAAQDALVVREGDVLVVSPDLKAGEVEVRLTDDAGESVFEQKVKGRVLDTYEVAPGSYDVEVLVTEDGTSGECVICPTAKEELAAQNRALDEALDQRGAEIEA